MTSEVKLAKISVLRQRSQRRNRSVAEFLGLLSRASPRGSSWYSSKPSIAGANNCLIAMLDADLVEHARNVIAHGFF